MARAILSVLIGLFALASSAQARPADIDDLYFHTYVGNDPANDTDPSGLCSDVNGCGPAAVQSQQVLSTPEGERAQVVTFATGVPIIAGTGVAATVGSPSVAAIHFRGRRR
jgi:hypothetical protein